MNPTSQVSLPTRALGAVEVYPLKYFIQGYFGPMANALDLEFFVVYPGKDGYAAKGVALGGVFCSRNLSSVIFFT